MAENSKIEWTTHTFNPWIGCTNVSPACNNCYAEALARRYGWAEWGPGEIRKRTSDANWKKPLAWDRAARAAGEHPFVFCASLADVFDNEVDPQWRTDLEKAPRMSGGKYQTCDLWVVNSDHGGRREALPPMPPTSDLKWLDERKDYLESPLDWTRNNQEAVEWLACNHVAIRAALAVQSTEKSNG